MQVIQILLNVLKLFGPLVTIAVAILTAYGMLKWSKRLGLATKELLDNPFSILFGLVVIALSIWFYFAKIAPLLKLI